MRTRATGCSGVVRSSEAFEGNARLGQRFWSQLRPVIHSPGGRHGRALTDAPGDLLLGGEAAHVEAEAAARQVHQVAVGVHEPGQDGAATEIAHRLADARIHVGPSPDEGDPPVAHDEGVGDRAGAVERVDPCVGQEHGGRPGALRRPDVPGPDAALAR